MYSCIGFNEKIETETINTLIHLESSFAVEERNLTGLAD